MEDIARSLKNLRKLRNEIKGIQIAIHANRKADVFDIVSGSSDIFPYNARRFEIRGTDIQRADRLQIKLARKKRQLEEEMIKAENFLEDVKNPEMRNILRLRYLAGLIWGDVARACGSTEEAVKKRDQRFFKKY